MAGLNKYQAYPEYRDSGVEWLGEVPSYWSFKKAKYIFQKKQRPLRDIDGVVTAFRDGQVTLRTNRRTDGFTNSLKEIGYQGVRRNDLVIHAMDGFAGAIGVSDSDGKCSPVCSVCTPRKSHSLNIHFYGYLVRQLAVTDFILCLAKGIRERSTEFRFSEFSELILAIPLKEEQDKIASFLDHETAKIDNLIEKQQQLIELLKEKRQAVISHAVTKGLNPDVPMKDSGVEWLEEIPNNWITMKLKFITTLKSEKIILPHTRYVGLENISSGDGNFIVTTDITPESTSLFFEKDDILFGKLRPYLAKAWLATFSGVCSSEFLVLKVEKLHPKYLNYFILSEIFIKQVDSSTYGTKMPRANWEDIGQLPIPLCSYEESKKIAMYLDKLTANLDILKEQQLQQIELLKERRTALISAAVTGKIDLRNWTAPIPKAETPTEASA